MSRGEDVLLRRIPDGYEIVSAGDGELLVLKRPHGTARLLVRAAWHAAGWHPPMAGYD